MADIKAIWSFSLDVECPHCGNDVDLTDYVDFWDGRPDSWSILNLKDEDSHCPECGEDFVCDFDY